MSFSSWWGSGKQAYLLNMPFGGGGGSCRIGGQGEDDGSGANGVCISGAQGNLPKPGPNTQYSPGSTRIGGVCPFPVD
ncbi:MAG: hypothetical protein U0R49_11635 [Fimbriimonadales bacterium]